MQYPVKLDSKIPEILQQAQALVGHEVTALADEVPSTNINPNSGKPYTNRYLQNVVPAGQMPAAAPAPQPTYTPPPQAVPAASFTTGAPPVLPPAPAYVPSQREEMGSEAFIARVTWLSSAATAARLMSNLIQPGADPSTVKNAGPVLFAIADAIYTRARQVEKGMLQQSASAQQGFPVEADDPGPSDSPPLDDDDLPFE